MHKIVWLFVLAMVVGLTPAMADIQPIDQIFYGSSWGQRFVADIGSYDRMIIQWDSGSLFEPPAFRNFSTNGWSVNGTDTLSWATSNTVQGPNVQFDILFLGSPVKPTTFKFWALNGTQVVDSALATWNGNWSFASIEGTSPPVSTPEPTLVLLMGVTGTLTLGGSRLLKRRLS